MKEPIKPKEFSTPIPEEPTKPRKTLSFYLSRPDPWWYDELGSEPDKKEFIEFIQDEIYFEENFDCESLEEAIALLDDDSATYKDMEKILLDNNENYRPSYSNETYLSLKEIQNKIPEHHKDLVIDVFFTASNYYIGDGESVTSIWAAYSIPNPNFNNEEVEYEFNLNQYKAALRSFKKAEKTHKTEMQKYRADRKKYKAWLTKKLEEIKRAG